jgi:hypothetical protein
MLLIAVKLHDYERSRILLVTKKIQIDFANRKYRACDRIDDITKAVAYAAINIHKRYGVILEPPEAKNGKVTLEVRIPEELGPGFNTGYRLRGIAAYLTRNYPRRYSNCQVGNRLLIYTEVGGSALTDDGFPEDVKVKAILKFTSLLLNEDPASKEKVERIMEILEE